MEGVAVALYSIKNTARELTPQKFREGLRTVAAESENIFSRYARQLPFRKVLNRTLLCLMLGLVFTRHKCCTFPCWHQSAVIPKEHAAAFDGL